MSPETWEQRAAPPMAEEYGSGSAFWGYRDLLTFLVMFVPSLAAAWLIFSGVRHWLPGKKELLALPMEFTSYLFWFASLWLLLRTKYDAPFWRSLGWRRPAGQVLVASALTGPFLALAVGITGQLLHTPTIPDPFLKLVNGWPTLIILGVAVALLGPVCEELAFRGFLQPLLTRDLGPVTGCVAAAIPFALLHGPQYSWQWQHVLLITTAGFIFGWTRYRTGSTLASTVMHAAYNTTLFSAWAAELVRTKHW